MRCGNEVWSGANDMSVFYCIPSDTVVMSEAFADMVTHVEPEGDRRVGVYDVVVSHELAHAVQRATAPTKSKLEDGESIMLKELQADCLSGQSMVDMAPGRIDGAYDFFNFVVPVIDFTHGTQAQRAEAFTMGLLGEGCTVSDILSITL